MPTRKSEKKTMLRGRDAESGQFIPVEEARRHKKTAVVERVPLPGKKRKNK